jgi:hypothetical protein
VDGVDLVTLGAGVAGCVATVLAGGRPGPDDTGLLRAAETALGRLGSLDEQERPYVERLCAPAVLVRIGQGVAPRARYATPRVPRGGSSEPTRPSCPRLASREGGSG